MTVPAFPPILKLVTGVVDVTTNGAVPVITVDVIIFALEFPVIETFPPIFISCPIPTPPVVVIDPVVVLIDGLLFDIFTLPVVDMLANVALPVTPSVPDALI